MSVNKTGKERIIGTIQPVRKGGDTCGKGEVGESFSRREILTGFYKWRSHPI